MNPLLLSAIIIVAWAGAIVLIWAFIAGAERAERIRREAGERRAPAEKYYEGEALRRSSDAGPRLPRL